MKRIFFSVILVFFLLHIWCNDYKEILGAANRDLMMYLEAIPEINIQSYGFQSGVQIYDARLGTPFQIAVINPHKVLYADNNSSFTSISEKTLLWYVPVLVNGNICCLLLIDRFNGKYQAVSIGYRALALSVSEYLKNSNDDIQDVELYQLRLTGTVYIHSSFTPDSVTLLKPEDVSKQKLTFTHQNINETISEIERYCTDAIGQEKERDR